MEPQANLALPTPQEIDRLIPIIKAECERAGLAIGDFARPSQGGLTLTARATPPQRRALTSALFAQGIVAVDLAPTLLAFAVRH